jgi:uncharacterized NAD(P)/FAD-binding protein YdhS
MIAPVTTPLRVAIVGGGLSGTLVAVHLLRQERAVHIDLIDARGAGRGLAYSTLWDEHLLNVPAVRMSAFGAEPMHFLEWLHANGQPDAAPDHFARRKLYGTYLQTLLETSIRAAGSRSRFRQHYSEATDLSYNSKRVRISLRNGDRIQADKAVLATGNPAPRLQGDFGSPWNPGAFAAIDPDREVLLIGAGLTAVDAFLALASQGHRAAIHVVSRRGQMPQAHSSYRPLPAPFDATGATGARELLRMIRHRVRQAEREGDDWRAVVDSLRPVTNDIWTSFELSEQRRVYRHAKTWWDSHRHRMAPEIGAKISAARASGQLRVYAGRVSNTGLPVHIALRAGGKITLDVQRVINCTGANDDYRVAPNPLIQALFDTGRIRPNYVGKGLQTNAHGALIDSDGVTTEWLLTLGPPRLGALLETIAVPEIRKQAEAMASYLSSLIYEPVETPVELLMAAGI